jgi:hypothetical protein
VSAKGDLALLLAPPGERGAVWLGGLVRVPFAGGPLRPLLDAVVDADWSPDGRELAVVRWRDGQYQLEYPIGRVLLRPAPPARVRVSPRGDHVALLDRGGLLLVDAEGRTTTLPLPPSHQRLAWARDGRSLLVDAGETDVNRTLRRVGLDGTSREVCALAGTLVVHDVSRDGRILIHHGLEHWGVRARGPEDALERDASVFANAGVAGLSADGRQILLWDGSQGPPGSALLRPTSGGPAVRLGDGQAHGLSEDGAWVALETATGPARRLAVVPTGSGEVVPLALDRLEPPLAAWLVEEDRVGINGAEPRRAARAFVAQASGKGLRPVTPEGTVAVPGLFGRRLFVAKDPDGSLALHSLEGERERPLGWKLPSDPNLETVRTSGDGRFLYVRTGSVPARVDRIALQTGARETWKALAPEDPTGTGHVWSIFLTPDAKGYAYTHGLFLQDLFLVDGLVAE